MRHAIAALIASSLLVTLLAGCIGGDGVDGGIPRAVVSMEEVSGKADTYLFDASRSTGKGLSFEWDFDDGTKAAEPVVEHTFSYGSSTYAVRLVITDAAGTVDFWSDEVVIGDGVNAAPSAFFSLPKRIFSTEEAVRVDASRSSDPTNDPLEYRWDFNHIMRFDAYEEFRAAKAGGSDGGDGEEENKSALDLPSIDDLVGPKHEGHGGENGDFTPSLFVHTAVTEDPVYVLEGGFPEQTFFFIRLQVVDIKGGYEDIVSEEIWPVEVNNNPPARALTGAASGTFDFGVPSAIASDFPSGGDYDQFYIVEYADSFPTEYPAELAYVNVTFNENPLAEAIPFENELRLEVRAPDFASPFFAQGTGGRLSIEITPQDEPGIGEWKFYLAARNGVDIEWDLSYWVKVDINPFRDMEEPYV